MNHYSFYNKETGVLMSRLFSTDDTTQLANNIPPDHLAIDGHHDHQRKRVNVETGELVDYRPPAPSADHVWDDGTGAWQLSPAALDREQRRRTANARMAALEMASWRALREHALGDPTAAARLKAIDDEIAGLRPDL